MELKLLLTAIAVGLFANFSQTAQAATAPAAERQAILGLAGCYLVDYSYAETESLKPGYVIDERVYDVNKDKSIKEWIYADEIGSDRIRIQHILFATDLDGELIEGTQLKHQGDDWEYEPAFIYDFTKPLNWEVKQMASGSGQWVRRITNLDDGLRYQCAAAWKLNAGGYPEWSCKDNYAPIPGRETRDMGRKDYNALMRNTRIVSYGGSWLERQDNVKTIDANGVRTPLAREVGKNWYVRIPDSECAPAQEFMKDKTMFWDLLRRTWDQVLVGDRPFVETPVAAGAPSRYMEMFMVEDKYQSLDLKDVGVQKAAESEILATIKKFRAN